MLTKKELSSQLYTLREEYLNKLSKYSFDNKDSLKPINQNATSQQAITTKHFLEFVLERIVFGENVKSTRNNFQATSNIIDKSLNCLITEGVGVDNKEAVVFSSVDQEIEFIFDYDKKEVVITAKEEQWLEEKKQAKFFCIIPIELFHIIQEYTSNER